MAGRRITYFALLLAAVLLHLVYGQYLTHYMVIFLLCVPVLSLLVSIPSAIGAEVRLEGGQNVCRNRETRVRLTLNSSSVFPPVAWRIVIASRNMFTGRTDSRQKVRIVGERSSERVFSPNTTQIGSVRYSIKRAFVFDHLGIFPIPVKKCGSVAVTVLPDMVKPFPEPDLVAESARVLKPKRQGFSEEHELRPYQDGDPLNLIHWKLSRKFDDFILREPQEVLRKDIILVIDPPEDYEEHTSVLEQLCYLDAILAYNEVPYKLLYGKRLFYINSANDFEDFILGVLSEPMKSDKARMPEGTKEALVYRIKPGRREDV